MRPVPSCGIGCISASKWYYTARKEQLGAWLRPLQAFDQGHAHVPLLSYVEDLVGRCRIGRLRETFLTASATLFLPTVQKLYEMVVHDRNDLREVL